MRPINQRVFAPHLMLSSPFEPCAFGNHFIVPTSFGNHLIMPQDPSLVQHLMSLAMKEAAARQAQKHRIRVDLRGLNPKNIKTEISADKSTLTVSGREADEDGEGDFFVKELRRTFKLPENVDTDKMTSVAARNGQLVIEFPIRREEEEEKKPAVGEESEDKSVRMSIELPENVDESKIKVTCRDHDVIVEAVVEDEPSSQGVTSSQRLYFYRRSTLPKHANMDAIKCLLENRTLTIEAPSLALQPDDGTKTIPIDVKPVAAEKNDVSEN